MAKNKKTNKLKNLLTEKNLSYLLFLILLVSSLFLVIKLINKPTNVSEPTTVESIER